MSNEENRSCWRRWFAVSTIHRNAQYAATGLVFGLAVDRAVKGGTIRS